MNTENTISEAANPACFLGAVSGCRYLYLSLKKEPFAVMVTGEKQEEFRKNSGWIRSRLFDKKDNEKKYDYIKFVNGYGADKPYFICKYFCVPVLQSDFVVCSYNYIHRF